MTRFVGGGAAASEAHERICAPWHVISRAEAAHTVFSSGSTMSLAREPPHTSFERACVACWQGGRRGRWLDYTGDAAVCVKLKSASERPGTWFPAQSWLIRSTTAAARCMALQSRPTLRLSVRASPIGKEMRWGAMAQFMLVAPPRAKVTGASERPGTWSRAQSRVTRSTAAAARCMALESQPTLRLGMCVSPFGKEMVGRR